MNIDNVINYLTSDNVGLSSKCMVKQYFVGCKNTDRLDYPHDLGDLNRCVLAFNALELKNIDYMSEVSSVWMEIAGTWLVFIDMLNSLNQSKEHKHNIYLLLQDCIKRGKENN